LKLAESTRNGNFRSQETHRYIKIYLAYNIQVSSKTFSQNISNQFSLCIDPQNLDPKSAENFQLHHFSTK